MLLCYAISLLFFSFLWQTSSSIITITRIIFTGIMNRADFHFFPTCFIFFLYKQLAVVAGFSFFYDIVVDKYELHLHYRLIAAN